MARDGSRAVLTHVHSLARPNARPQLLKLAGLEPDADYRDMDSGTVYGGDELMLRGIAIPPAWDDYASTQIWLEKI